MLYLLLIVIIILLIVLISQSSSKTNLVKVPINMEYLDLFRSLFSFLPNPELENQQIDECTIKYLRTYPESKKYPKITLPGRLQIIRKWNSLHIKWHHKTIDSFTPYIEKEWKFKGSSISEIEKTLKTTIKDQFDREYLFLFPPKSEIDFQLDYLNDAMKKFNKNKLQ